MTAARVEKLEALGFAWQIFAWNQVANNYDTLVQKISLEAEFWYRLYRIARRVYLAFF
jgi:hypothetical protein